MTRLRTLRALLLLVLWVGAAAPSLAKGPLFAIPMAVVPAVDAELAALPEDLRQHSDALAATPETGYDWVFPYIYAKTTLRFVRAVRSGEFEETELLARWIAQFYEVYGRNAKTWLSGGTPEEGWARAAWLSRSLARFDGDDTADSKAAALLQALVTVYVHIGIDLPRAVFVIDERSPVERDPGVTKELYFEVNRVFGGVVEEMIEDARISPEVLKEAWPHLPGWMRRMLASGPVGFATYLRVLRRIAWWRFRWMRLSRTRRDQVADLPVAAGITPVPLPVPGEVPRMPAAPTSSFGLPDPPPPAAGAWIVPGESPRSPAGRVE